MEPDRRLPLRLLGVMFGLVFATFAIELFFELRDLPEWPSLRVDAEMVRAVGSPFARAFNQLLTLVLTFIALAIPITANLYTPKLLKIFLHDRVNLAVLCALGVLAAHSILTLVLSFDRLTGQITYWVATVGALVGWTAIVPYYYYVLHFLNPETIIARVLRALTDELEALPTRRLPAAALQKRVDERVLDLGQVLQRAVERTDHDVAIQAVRAVAEAFRAYLRVKPELPAGFFQVGSERFTGPSRAALELINTDRVWVEHKLMQTMQHAYQVALSKVPDAVSTISDAAKMLGMAAAERGDRTALALMLRFFNTFIRMGLRQRDVRAIFDVFYQYKSLARRLLDTAPDVVPEIADHFRYYAVIAGQLDIPFVRELGAYELAELAELAIERGKDAESQALTGALLEIDGLESSAGLVKARALLGAYLVEHGHTLRLAQLVASMDGVPRDKLEQAEREILATDTRYFREVNDRQVNFDYLEPERRPHVRAFFARLGKAA